MLLLLILWMLSQRLPQHPAAVAALVPVLLLTVPLQARLLKHQCLQEAAAAAAAAAAAMWCRMLQPESLQGTQQ
jgi:hypothetical protein